MQVNLALGLISAYDRPDQSVLSALNVVSQSTEVCVPSQGLCAQKGPHCLVSVNAVDASMITFVPLAQADASNPLAVAVSLVCTLIWAELVSVQSVGAAQGAKPTAVAAAALRTVFASLSQQAARGGAAALAGVPDHVRDTLWRDFATAGVAHAPTPPLPSPAAA